jgi:hypothetical protein
MNVPSILNAIDSSCKECDLVWKPLQQLLTVIIQLNATYRGDFGGVERVLQQKDWLNPTVLLEERLCQLRNTKGVKEEAIRGQNSEGSMLHDWFGQELEDQSERVYRCDFKFWYELLQEVFYDVPDEVSGEKVSLVSDCALAS